MSPRPKPKTTKWRNVSPNIKSGVAMSGLPSKKAMELTEVLLAQRGRTDCALVDCITIWLSNLLLRRDTKYAEEKVEELLKILPRLDFHRVFVTNEVGWGIVPDNPLARQFRDLAGWTNQRIAAIANEVVSYRCRNPHDREAGNFMSLDETLKQIRPLDRIQRSALRSERLDSLTKPQGSLGQIGRDSRAASLSSKERVPPQLGAKTFVRLCRGPWDYAGRRQRLSERRHGADDLQFSQRRRGDQCFSAPSWRRNRSRRRRRRLRI